jgi:hypothetical protein
MSEQSKIARGVALLAANGLVLYELFQALRTSDAIVASWETGTRLILVLLSSFGLYRSYCMLDTAQDDKLWRGDQEAAMWCFGLVVIAAITATPLMQAADDAHVEPPAAVMTTP